MSPNPPSKTCNPRLSYLKAQIHTLTSAPPPPTGHHASSSHPQTSGASANSKGMSAAQHPPRPEDLPYPEVHLTLGYLGDPGYGKSLAHFKTT
ncbi:unnamed protein product [Linum trigynum]|uniref:Uncharacterized protein n=1 Tax=Linum trigynum TaxID=586398 RepID=A0AAV2GM90_9ROSI